MPKPLRVSDEEQGSREAEQESSSSSSSTPSSHVVQQRPQHPHPAFHIGSLPHHSDRHHRLSDNHLLTPTPHFPGVFSNSFKRPRTVSPPLSADDSENEVDSRSPRSSRSNSLSSGVEPPSSSQTVSAVPKAGSGRVGGRASHPHALNPSNIATPLRFSFNPSDLARETGMSSPPSSSSGKLNGNLDGLLTEKMLSLKDGDAAMASSSPASSLPSYSQAMGQSIEVHTPPPEVEDPHASVAPIWPSRPAAEQQYSSVIEAQKQPLQYGASWFIVDRPWFQQWSRVCNEQTDRAAAMDAIGMIETSHLLDPTFPTALKTGLEEGVDFEVVPKEAWEMLVGCYGRSGPAIERKVIKMPPSDSLRLELYPPVLHVYYASQQAVAPVSVTLSVTQTLSDLKAKIRSYVKQHQPPTQENAQVEWRFWRLPALMTGVGSISLKALQALDGKELIRPDSDASPLAELQIDQPVERLAVETRATNAVWPLEQIDKGSTASLKGIFRQDGNDFLSKIQRGEKGQPAASAAADPASKVDATGVGRVTRSQTAADRGSDRQRGLTGLYNLGNTCFMNAALQCMSNTKELKDYFVSGVYKTEVNATNPLGMGGAMAKVFGELLMKLWSNGGGAWHPREFKTVLSRFSPQFIGYAQQDTQELLAFLLDGLHEDLNRIIKKPYIEAPDWEGGDLKEMVMFARKQWEIYKMRNDSVIVDLFQGQYRSTLVCPDCSKVSIKFDPFMYLTLPIPNRKSFVRKVLFLGQNRDPVEAEVRLTNEMSFAQLKRKLSNWFSVANPKALVACDVFSRSFYRVYSDFDPVSEIGQHDITYVFELPKPLEPIAPVASSRYYNSQGKVADVEEKNEPPVKPEEMAILPLFSVTTESRSTYPSYSVRGTKTSFGQPFFLAVSHDKVNDVAAVQEAAMQAYLANVSDRNGLQAFLDGMHSGTKHSSSNVSEDWDMLDDDSKVVVPPEGDVNVEDTVAEIIDEGQTVRIVPDGRTKAVDQEDESGSSKAPAKATGKPFSLHFIVHREDSAPITLKAENFETCGEELNERAGRLGLLSGSSSDVEGEMVEVDDAGKGVERESSSRWPLVYTGGALVCMWTEEARDRLFKDNEDAWSRKVENFVDPELEADRQPDAKRNKRTLTIEDCLNEFTKEEQLGESDPWYCPHCKDFKQATKKFDLWKVPDILVVHLKRFSSGRIGRDKIDSLIDFPIDGLDLTERVEGAKAVQQVYDEGGNDDKMMDSISSLDANDDAVESDAPIYDLYAVDNHYGGLGGGHYTAFAKNPEDEKWYYFDDSSVRPVRDINEIKSPAAYLLFYRRRTTRPIGGKSREKVRQRVKEEEGKDGQTDNNVADQGNYKAQTGAAANGEASASETMDTDMSGSFMANSHGHARLAPIIDPNSTGSGWKYEDDPAADVPTPVEDDEESPDMWGAVLGSSYRRNKAASRDEDDVGSDEAIGTLSPGDRTGILSIDDERTELLDDGDDDGELADATPPTASQATAVHLASGGTHVGVIEGGSKSAAVPTI